MRVDLAFGKNGLSLELPGQFDYRILEARGARPLADPARALEDALARPIGSLSLGELARGRRSAAISVCDITRPAPNRQTLPPILRTLAEAGITAPNITILVATGLHRAATAEEIDLIVGPGIARQYIVLNHDARNLDEHRYLGATRKGTPAYIDRRFIDADLHITLGFIEPHLMLGLSGGRKLIVPGLAAQETIKVIHSPKFMREPLATEGSIEENPLHRELCEIAGMARHDFMLDVALARDRSIAGVFAGNAIEAHREGVRFVSKTLLERLDEPVDAVITSAAGYPLDMTFYQAIKGITAAHHILKPGGKILLLAECQEGAGAPEFRHMLRTFGSYGAFLDAIRETPVIPDQWQLEKLALVAGKHEVLFYVPGLGAEYREHFGANVFDSPDAAVAALCASLRPGAKVAVIPEGPYVLARVAEMAGAA
jgi:nickel-dependent lactate racemase